MEQKQRKHQRRNNALEAGDLVTIANRFFNNHALPHAEHGIGQIKKLEPGSPYVWAEFASHGAFMYYAEKAYILEMDRKGHKTLIKIHPVYLEKVELKRHGKEK